MSSVFFHVQAGLQSGEAGIPFQSKDLHGSDGDRVPGFFNFCLLTSTEYFIIQKTFGIREQSVIRLDLIALIHILFQTVGKGLWNGNNSVAFWRLWRPDYIPAVDALKCLINRDCMTFQIYICSVNPKFLHTTFSIKTAN